MLTKDTSTCILFWAKVLPQHESTVWLLMSYFACGSMSQLLSESKCYVGKRGINFAKSPSTLHVLRLNEGDDQFQVCNFAFGATIGLHHDTSGRLSALGRFPSRGAEKLQSSDFATEQNMTKIQTTSSRNDHHLLWYCSIEKLHIWMWWMVCIRV